MKKILESVGARGLGWGSGLGRAAGLVRRMAAVVVGAGIWSAASAQDLTHKAPPQRGAVVLTGGVVHTMTADPIPDGYVYFRDGRIQAVGPSPMPRLAGDGARIIDVSGRHVFPGMISGDTQLGLVEFPPVLPTVDTTELGDVTPEVRPISAVNPDSTLLPVTRSNGVLVVGVMPSGGAIPGQVSVMRLDGWTWEEMSVRDSAGVLVNWPNVRPITAWWMDRSSDDQMREIRARVLAIEESFETARAYLRARSADPSGPADLRWEAMRGVFRDERADVPGEDPSPDRCVFITANERDQITAAVTWAARAGVRAVIVGGRDAGDCADLLVRHDVAVIVDGTFSFPRRDDSPYDAAFTLPARLHAAGVRFCLSSGDRTANERNLPYNAGLAVAHGLDRAAAHRSITLWPAMILGIEDRYGSIEAGKSATLIVTDGDPLEVRSNVRMAFIDGKEIDLRNKQSDLAEKYRTKYRQREGGDDR
ncbi:MAG: amidohydrolase family protein [Phycisphaeraceae bacterium]|nr:amidohydrolase family protein [Phycisphaerae bacterium]MBX3393102.1 amidohydrolase family protein [Phycisphaeraceae bacterium]